MLKQLTFEVEQEKRTQIITKVTNFKSKEEAEKSIRMLHDWQILDPLLTTIMKNQECPEILQNKSLFKNKVGLNRFDSGRFTTVYKKYQNNIGVTGKEIKVVREKIVKYWHQL
ncbi:MAG: hypothetical protein WA130_07260 [Candidatus Methanoperedens sp.]